MLLDCKKIEEITVGAVSVEDVDGAFKFHRFTSEQEALYRERNAERINAVSHTSGISLDFITDSSEISVGIYTDPFIQRSSLVPTVDIYEDDLLVYSAEITAERTVHRVALSDGEKRVRIYPDCYAPCRIFDVSVDDGASVRPTPHRAHALIYGDSITHGARASHPSFTYANRALSSLGWSGINQAIGGEAFRGWIPGTTRVCNPDVILVAYGTNDWYCRSTADIASFENDFFTSIRAIYKDTPVIYISPIWRNDIGKKETPGGDFYATVRMMEDIARSYGATVIHGLELVPHSEEFLFDGLHPNDTGFLLYSDALVKAIKRIDALRDLTGETK